MTHYLQSVLSKKDNDPLFSAGLKQLEKSSGDSGVDTRLIADILEKAHHVMRQLGLDTKNTTAHELYRALIASVQNGTCEDILLDSDYVLIPVHGRVISLNLIDVINNAHHELDFDRQIFSHGQRSLQGELINRYLCHSRTDEATTNEIASSMGITNERDTWFDSWYTKYKHERKQIDKNLEDFNR